MARRMKMLVLGSLPAICGISVSPALGEKISWPEMPSPALAFRPAVQAEATPRSTEEAHALRLRELQLQAQLEVELLRARQQELEQRPVFIDGMRP